MEEQFRKMIQEAVEIALTSFNPTSTVPVKEIMKVEELAEYLQVSRAWIYQNMESIPVLDLGGCTRFKKQDIDQWLATRHRNKQEAKAIQQPVHIKNTGNSYKVV